MGLMLWSLLEVMVRFMRCFLCTFVHYLLNHATNSLIFQWYCDTVIELRMLLWICRCLWFLLERNIVSSIHWGLFSSEVPCPLTAHPLGTGSDFAWTFGWYICFLSHIIYIWLDYLLTFIFCKFLLLFIFTRTNDPRVAIDRIVRGFFLDTFFLLCLIKVLYCYVCL